MNKPIFLQNKTYTALALLCFALADIHDGLGPFLGVYLQQLNWTADNIGYVMTAGSLIGLLCSAPFGAFADYTPKKRSIIALAVLCIVASSAGIIFWHSFSAVTVTRIMQGAAASAITPALTGITLGIVGQKGLAMQLGRNEAWNHAGNAGTAILSGLTGYFFDLQGVLAVLAAMGILALYSLRSIDPAAIDYAKARGLTAPPPLNGDQSINTQNTAAVPDKTLPKARLLLKNNALLLISGTLFFFHLGNAALLPLLGQSAVARFNVNPALYTALTIVLAQCTMIITALWAAKKADKNGYALLFYYALLALPVRGIIAGFWVNPWNIIPVQILDGVGAGLLGVAMPGLTAQILQKSGHINLGLGCVLTIQGIGAALSNAYGGFFAHSAGYNYAFLALAAAPCIGLILFSYARKKQTL